MPNESGKAHLALGPGREFDVVRELLAQWGELARGVGDDAAVVDVPAGQRLVVSTDTSVDGVHFRRGWLTPREIGWRATAAALSDLAAMAASPLGMLLALVLPEDAVPLVRDLASGIGDAAAACRTPILGGDISAGATLTLAVTVLGAAAAPVRRDGARRDDLLYITGKLGGPGAALRALEEGLPLLAAHRERFAHPLPRLAEAQWLAEAGAHALIDVSDGLASDVRHVAAASNAHIEVNLDLLPTLDGVSAQAAALSGEEYELIAAAPRAIDTVAFEGRFGLPLTLIGRVTGAEADLGGHVTFTSEGERVDLALGYDHLSS